MAGIGISADYKTPWVLELYWMVAVVGLINLYLLAVECIGIGIALSLVDTRSWGKICLSIHCDASLNSLLSYFRQI